MGGGELNGENGFAGRGVTEKQEVGVLVLGGEIGEEPGIRGPLVIFPSCLSAAKLLGWRCRGANVLNSVSSIR